MTYDFASQVGYERDGQGTIFAQGLNDEVLRVIRVRGIQERRHRYGVDGRNI